MRTTIDLPEDLYRALKTRAAMTGVTMRDLVRRLVEQGLRQPEAGEPPRGAGREAPPVIIPPRGIPIPALPRKELHRMEEQEDVERHGRSARR